MAASAKLSSSIVSPINLSPKSKNIDRNKICYGSQFSAGEPIAKLRAIRPNGSVSNSASQGAQSRAVGEVHRQSSSLESLFCYDKPIPEELIGKPVGLALAEKVTGDNAPCTECQAKGVVLCATCSGSGLYVDSILESQGIIVKVRCLGCGGTGNIMCSECGGRGHLGRN